MNKNKHAVALGRKGGKVTSVAKAKASRENGKKGGRPVKAMAVLACLLALVAVEATGQIGRAFGLMPMGITRDPQVKILGGSERLGYLHAVVQRTGGPGPQALEGYTLVDQPGTVELAMGTIGNVEVAGSGTVKSVRPLQAGGVVTGPAVVEQWSALTLFAPQRGWGYDGPMNVKRVDFVTFSNGWSLRPSGQNGDGLQICSPTNVCREF